MSELFPVNQDIREAAANLCDEKKGYAVSAALREGRNDSGMTIQAFAKFEAERSCRYKKALEEIVAGGFNCSTHQYYMAAQGVAERALGTET